MATYYKPLTGVRALAAYLVFLHHYFPDYVPALRTAYSPIFNEFHIGVTIFFTLSGFLITSRYLDQNRLNRAYLGRYFLNRIARIYPTYLLLTAITFGFVFAEAGLNKESIVTFLLNVSFLRGFSDLYAYSGIPQGWSLTVEETFYLVAPLLLYALARVTARRYALTLTLFVLASMAAGVGLTAVLHGRPLGFFHTYDFLFQYTFFGRATEFAIGAGLALVLRQRATLPLRTKAAAGATLLGVAGVAATIPLLMLVRTHYHVAYGIAHWSGSLLNNVGLPVMIALLFYGLVVERTWLAQLLASPAMQALGKSSYCFYLLHAGPIPEKIIMLLPFLRNGFLFFGLLVVLSLGLHYGFEEPVNRRLRSWFRKPESSTDHLVPTSPLTR